MDDHRVHADLSHQNDVTGESVHGLVIAHGVTAELDDDDGTCIALQIGKCLGQCPCGGDPVAVHVSFFHPVFLWPCPIGWSPPCQVSRCIPPA